MADSISKSQRHQPELSIVCDSIISSTLVASSSLRKEYLIHGFIRECQYCLKNKTIPMDVNTLCLLFIDNNEYQLRPIKCHKLYIKKGITKTKVFIWGKAYPPNMFPDFANQFLPYAVDNLSRTNIHSICAARDGAHAFGIGKNNWCFVWGETKQIGALGLGTNATKSTPFLIRSLRKQVVTNTCCSSKHSLWITDELIIYGSGDKSLTLLEYCAKKPTPLNYLNGKGLNNLCASNTHSLAWNPNNTMDIYSFGTHGPWLGYGEHETVKAKTFGKMKFDSFYHKNQYSIKNADCWAEYTLVVSNMGHFGSCGINQHGRMGVGKNVNILSQIKWNTDCTNIVSCSAGVFHSGFVDDKGKVYTSGLGKDYRLGHGNVDTLWTPKQIDSMKNVEIYKIKCVECRTFVITTDGLLIKWGQEVLTGKIRGGPFVHEYLRTHIIFDICCAKDFNIVVGIRAETPIPKPDVNILMEQVYHSNRITNDVDFVYRDWNPQHKQTNFVSYHPRHGH